MVDSSPQASVDRSAEERGASCPWRHPCRAPAIVIVGALDKAGLQPTEVGVSMDGRERPLVEPSCPGDPTGSLLGLVCLWSAPHAPSTFHRRAHAVITPNIAASGGERAAAGLPSTSPGSTCCGPASRRLCDVCGPSRCVGGGAVEVLARTVVAAGGAGIAMAGEVVHVAQRRAGVEGEGDRGVAQ